MAKCKDYDVQAQAKRINKPSLAMPKGATSHVVNPKNQGKKGK